MLKTLLVALFVASAVLAISDQEYQEAFLEFTRTYSKSYHHDEFVVKYTTFKKNMNYIDSFNAKEIKAGSSLRLAINEFADLTNAEYKQLLGLKTVELSANNVLSKSENVSAAPADWDWRKHGAVTPIKNQGQCGSCWSFSTTGSVEGCHFLDTNKLVALSEQNLMDCSTAQGNQGCDGGLMTDAMTYIIDNNGIDTEASYPYTAEDGTCHYSAANRGSTLTSFVNVNQGDEQDLKAKAYEGPTSVAIDASQSSFQFYSTGVYYSSSCSSTQLDHGVLVVGYGVTSSGNVPDYWIVKNSWGTSWGMNGFIWMARNKQNNCGIATMATLPKGCK